MSDAPDEIGQGDVEARRGFRWEEGDPEELRVVVEAAFDYRGDVTLTLSSGEELTAYVSNRAPGPPEPFIQVFPSDGSPRRRIPYGEIRGIVFSGKDPASGKSWETWVAKWKAKKDAEARGESVGDVGLYPEKLD